jgi:enediyne polyketide synthase
VAETPAIAIVGGGCRYPDAEDPDRLWEMVLARRRAFRPIPRARLNLDDYGASDPGEFGQPDPDTTDARLAAVLDGWVFDRSRFRIPGAAYRVTDLTHWLALDVAAQTLESAGFPGAAGLNRDRVGVVIGNTLAGEFSRAALLRFRWPYVRRVLAEAMSAEGLTPEAAASLMARTESGYKAPFPEPTDESLSGGLANIIAGRICNHFDLHGGGYTVDGACASSLLAVSTACTALLTDELDLVLAGGVDLSLDPFELIGFSRVGAISAGEMRVYDAEPTGFLPGEGCGMVALMRAEDAAAAGRTPWALIRGWGISSDGRGGLTRPELSGQLIALRRAYDRAGFGPETVALFEGHGTGTAVGDRVELEALIEANGGRRVGDPAAIGSIKANIGHTKAAAGVASLIKATLAVRHQIIPPTTGCHQPHQLLTGPGAPLRISDGGPWPDAPVRAGVSAMGFGGINTHVVVEGGPRRRSRVVAAAARSAFAAPVSHEVFALSAASARQLAATLTRVAEIAPALSFAEHADLAAALATTDASRTRSRDYRLAIVSRDPGQLARRAQQALAQLSALERAPEGRLMASVAGVFGGRGAPCDVGLLFPGQGAPLPAGPGALGQIFPEARPFVQGIATTGDGTDTAHAQPAVLRASLAGLRWLDRLGVRASAAVGHSLGEITALCWAGALTEASALDLVTRRGLIMSRLGARTTGMASVPASPGTVAELIAGTRLVVAADNGTAQVVAGTLTDIDLVIQRARMLGIAARPLTVSHAFHSPAVAAARPALAAMLAHVTFGLPTKTVYSTVYGRRLTSHDDLRAMLGTQLTAPVLFRQATECLAAQCAVLIEVGPGHGLTALVPGVASVPAAALDVGADSAESLCQVAAALLAAGATRGLLPMFACRFHRPFDLWRNFEFLASPCEYTAAPVRPVMVSVAPDQPSRSAPHTPPDAAAAAAPQSHRIAGRTESASVRTDPDVPAEVTEHITGLVADLVELPPGQIRAADRLLSDLHLSSLQVAGLVARVAAERRRTIPTAPLSFADASIADLGAVIESLPPARADGSAMAAPGVTDWHLILVEEVTPDVRVRPAPSTDPHLWHVYGTSPLRTAVERLLTAAPEGPPAVLAFLPGEPGDGAVMTLLTAARRAVAEAIPLTVVDHGDTASGFLATICQEHPGLPVRLIRLAARTAESAATEMARAIAAAGVADTPGFSEMVVDETGRGCVGYRPLYIPWPATLPAQPGEVALITGGGRGIGLETALALGRRAGVGIGLLGRGDPDDDDELQANLARLTASGVIFRYEQADVSDAPAVRAAVSRITAALGPVTLLIHAAGVNRPARFDSIPDREYTDHSTPKHRGLRTVMDALDTSRLRAVLAYGSVIGRFGLAGEAHYALANGRMREMVRAAASRMPGCWVCNVEWTAWAGTGMGERLGVLDQLDRVGVSPLPLDRGVELLMRLLAHRPAVSSLVVTGRLPQLDQAEKAELESEPGYRYVQRTVAFTPGVELVAEADLGLREDPYLADHRIDGLALLPAVCALEAMAQAAVLLSGRPVACVRDGRFDRPVIVPAEGIRTIRICALCREDGTIDVVLRSDETAMAVDHFSCRITTEAPDPPAVPARRTPLPEHRAARLYETLLFHGPAFRLLRRYEHLAATACTAVLDSSQDLGGPVPPQLGNMARNDASIHALQACVPQRRLLPVGCDRFTVHQSSADQQAPHELTLAAAERSHVGPDYAYDVVVRDTSGRPVVSWTGLRLRDIGPIDIPAGLPRLLLSPYLQHGVAELLPVTGLSLEVLPAVTQTQAQVPWPPSASCSPAGVARSCSPLDGLLLQASAPGPVACDWEPVTSHDKLPGLRQIVPWADQAEQLHRLTGEQDEFILTRLWTALECLRKIGRTAPGPFVVQGAYEQGWVLLRAGSDVIATTVLKIDGEACPLAVAILAGDDRASLL